MTTQNLVQGGDAGRWEQAIYAFLAEKERRSERELVALHSRKDSVLEGLKFAL